MNDEYILVHYLLLHNMMPLKSSWYFWCYLHTAYDDNTNNGREERSAGKDKGTKI